MNQWDRAPQKRGLRRFTEQRSRERQKSYRFAAQTRGKRLPEGELAMRRFDRGPQSLRAQDVSQSANGEDGEKADADAGERVEDRSNANAVDDISEKSGAESEGDQLQSRDGTARDRPRLLAASRRFLLFSPFYALCGNQRSLPVATGCGRTFASLKSS